MTRANPTAGPKREGADPYAHDASTLTFIDRLLQEQRELSAVDRFSSLHDQRSGHALAAHYRDLIPLSAPRPGEQYAFDVDLDACSGCKGCVTACHSMNGLDDGETWREVGLLLGETHRDRLPQPGRFAGREIVPLQATVTTACHHCVDPGCLSGCPVLAYEKDPVTGIVRHLDDQCMGCSYCIMKCPYEVPRFSEKRGIVRKCDMCHGRLAEGEAPACVQACPNQAIRITTVVTNSVRIEFRKPAGDPGFPPQVPLPGESVSSRGSPQPIPGWLPDAPDPGITLPATRYRTSKPAAAFRASDHFIARSQPAHLPLVFMLVLSQWAAGAWIALALHGWNSGGLPKGFTTAMTILLMTGLACSVAHLGQPLKSWRAFLGWRTSWLSREILALNGFFGTAVALATAIWVLPFSWLRPALILIPPAALAAVFASAMVYIDTHRRFWNARFTLPRFLGTTVMAAVWALGFLQPVPSVIPGLLILVTAIKLALEVSVLRAGDDEAAGNWELKHTAQLQTGRYRMATAFRCFTGVLGGMLIPFLQFASNGPRMGGWIAAGVILMSGESIERFLFFVTVQSRRMPGKPR